MIIAILSDIHDHIWNLEKVLKEIKGKKNEGCGKTILLNPGAVCGIQNGKSGIASYAFYTTIDNTADIKIIQ